LDEVAIQLRYEALDPVLDERGRRRFAAAEARSAGWSGVLALSRITGMARSTIGRGWPNCGARRRMSRRVGFVELAAGGRNSRPGTSRYLMRQLVEPAHCQGQQPPNLISVL
jgi:hypothetical protein